MSCSEFYKSRAGAEGFKTFFQFLSLPPITQKFPKGKKRSGENEVVVCETNFKDAKAKCVKGNLCLEKQSAFLFDQGIEKTQKVCEDVSNKKTFRRPVEHPQSFSRALGKKNIDRVCFVAPQL